MRLTEEKELTYRCPVCKSKVKIKGSEFTKDIIPIVRCPSCGKPIRKDFDWVWNED